MVTLVNRTARIIGLTGLRGGAAKYPPIAIKPTEKNKIQIAEDHYHWLCRDKMFKTFIQKHMLKVEGATAPRKSEAAPDTPREMMTTELGVHDAMAAVMKETDTDMLAAWYEHDDRKTVRRKIETRLTQLEPVEDQLAAYSAPVQEDA